MSSLHPPAVVIRRSDQQYAGGTPSSRVRFIALGSHTTEDYGLYEYHLPPGAKGARPHYHEHFSDRFYILEGRLSLLSGTDRITLSAGDLAYVPRNGIHGFDKPGARGPQLQEQDVLAVHHQRVLAGHSVEQASRTSVARLSAAHADPEEGGIDGDGRRQWVL